MEGFFHDAHEVYATDEGGERQWVATFATKGLADWYVTAATEAMLRISAPVPAYEVVPV